MPAPSEPDATVRSSLGWVAGGQIAYFTLQFGTTVVLARLLTPYEVGIFAIGFAMVGLLSVIQALGLNNYLIRDRSLDPTTTATVYTLNFIIALRN